MPGNGWPGNRYPAKTTTFERADDGIRAVWDAGYRPVLNLVRCGSNRCRVEVEVNTADFGKTVDRFSVYSNLWEIVRGHPRLQQRICDRIMKRLR